MANKIGRIVSAEELRKVFDAEAVATYVHIVSGRNNRGVKEPVTHYALLNPDGTLPSRTLCARKIARTDKVRSDKDAGTCTPCNRQRFFGGGVYP